MVNKLPKDAIQAFSPNVFTTETRDTRRARRRDRRVTWEAQAAAAAAAVPAGWDRKLAPRRNQVVHFVALVPEIDGRVRAHTACRIDDHARHVKLLVTGGRGAAGRGERQPVISETVDDLRGWPGVRARIRAAEDRIGSPLGPCVLDAGAHEVGALDRVVGFEPNRGAGGGAAHGNDEHLGQRLAVHRSGRPHSIERDQRVVGRERREVLVVGGVGRPFHRARWPAFAPIIRNRHDVRAARRRLIETAVHGSALDRGVRHGIAVLAPRRGAGTVRVSGARQDSPAAVVRSARGRTGPAGVGRSGELEVNPNELRGDAARLNLLEHAVGLRLVFRCAHGRDLDAIARRVVRRRKRWIPSITLSTLFVAVTCIPPR